MKLKIVQDFLYFHGGCNRVDYAAGQDVETDDAEMVDVAVANGWAKKADKPAENKAHKAAPENKKAR